MHWLWQHVRYGFRGLRKQPGFAFLAVLTLALGIGAATTIFSVIYNVLLDPTPYLNADRIVSIQIRDATNPRPGGRMFFQTPEFLDYQEQTTVYEEVIGGSGARTQRNGSSLLALKQSLHMAVLSPNRGLNTRRLSPTTRKASGVFGACARGRTGVYPWRLLENPYV